MEEAEATRNQSTDQINDLIMTNKSFMIKVNSMMETSQNIAVVGADKNLSYQNNSKISYLMERFGNNLDTLFSEAGLNDRFPNARKDFQFLEWDCDELIRLFCSCKDDTAFIEHNAFLKSKDPTLLSWSLRSKIYHFLLQI